MDNEIFPYNHFIINISLSQIEGTLLYTIDKNCHQLIITLSEEIVEIINIEFNKEKHVLSLFELCGCEKCKYRWLRLTIFVSDLFNIQCNHMKNFQLKYGKNDSINIAYPMINSTNNTAGIWLINTPSHENGYSNNDQLSGCISEIIYNKKHLNMTIIGNNIETGCHISCTKGVCDSGVCLETFTIQPLCDCTDSNKNGPFCNSSGHSFKNASVLSSHEIYKFKIIKLTWESESEEIFYLRNEKLSIAIKCENNSILFIYNSILNRLNLIKKLPIMKMSEIKIIFITFGSNAIIIKGPQISSESIPILTDLSDNYFSSMILLNGTGYIDVSYKVLQSDYLWNQIPIERFQRVSIIHSINHVTRNYEENMKNHILFVYIVISVSIFIILIISNISTLWLYLIYKRNTLQNNYEFKQRNNSGEQSKTFISGDKQIIDEEII